MNVRLLIISLLCIMSGAATAMTRNELFFRKLGNPKEAFGDEVHQILVDRDGYAWISTTDRLLRFDGKEVRSYGNRKIVRLVTDSAGILLACGPHSMYRYNRATDIFDSVADFSKAIADNMGYLWKFPADRSDVAYVGNIKVKVPSGVAAALLSGNGKDAYVLDSTGVLWHTCSGGEAVKVDSIALSTVDGASLFQDRDGNIWLWDSFSPGIHQYIGNGRGHVTVLPHLTIRSIDQNTDGSFYIASNDNGLLVSTPGFESVSPVTTTGLPSNHTSFVRLDTKGRLWLGATWGPAMAKLNRLCLLRHRIDRAVDISSVVELSGGEVWLALDGDGIMSIGDNDRILRHRSRSDGEGFWNKTTRIMPVDGYRLLALTYGDGVHIYDTSTDKVARIYGAPDHARAAAYAGKSKTYWIGSHMKGLHGFDKDFKPIANFSKINSGLRTDFINDLCVTPDDTVYVATGYGVYKFHAPEGSPRPAADALSELSARCIVADARGNVWIGTARGLLRYRPSTGRVSRVLPLGNECINKLSTDSRGHLWVLSPAGLHRIMAAPDGRLYTSAYLLGEDIPAINVVGMSMGDGKIYLSGNGKYIELELPPAHPEKPSRILLPDFAPDVTSLNFIKGNAPAIRVATDELSEAIPYFEYRFNREHEWIEAIGGAIPLDSLDYGVYSLEIRLAGNIESPVKTVDIEIRRPMSARIKICAAIIAAMLVIGIVSYIWLKKRNGNSASAKVDGKATQRITTDTAASVSPSPVSASSQDERFLHRAKETVEQNIADSNFGVDGFAEKMCISRSGLYKRLTAITGLSPIEYIRQMRIKRGRDLIKAHAGTVAEVAFMVGMTPRQFSKFYKSYFGVPPSMDSRDS